MNPYEQLINSGTPAQEAANPAAIPPPALNVSPQTAPQATPQTSPASPETDPGFFSWPNGGLYTDVLPAVNKFSNNALFNIPAAVMKRIGNEANFNTNAKNKTVDTIAGLAGTGASIPLSIATGNALGVGTKIGANALLGAGMSGAAPAISGEKDWGNKAILGGAFGGGGAVLGKVAEKVLPAAFQNLKTKAEDIAEELDNTGLASLFDLKRGDIKKVLGQKKAFSGSTPGLEATEDVSRGAADLIRAKGIYGEAKLKDFVNGLGPEYKKAAQAFDDAGVKLTNFQDPIFQKAVTQPEVQTYLQHYADEGGVDKITEILKKFDKRGNWTEGRAYLSKEQSNLYRTPGGSADKLPNGELADAVGAIKHVVTEHGFELGGVDPELTGLYRDSRVLHNLALRKASSPTDFAKAGSKTTAGLVAAATGNIPAAAGASVLADIVNTGATKLVNKGAGYLALQAAPIVRSKIVPLAERMTPTANRIADSLSATGGNNLAGAIRALTAQPLDGIMPSASSPESESTGTVDPESPQFNARLEQGIRNKWIADGNGYFDPDFTSPQFRQVVETVKQGIKQAGPDGPRRAANLLFPGDEKGKEAYLEYLSNAGKASAALPGAQIGNPISTGIASLPLVGNQDSIVKRAQLLDALSKALGGKETASAVMTQLDRAPPEKRKEIINKAMGRSNPLAKKLIEKIGGSSGV